MTKTNEAIQKQREALQEELEAIGAFRRGSINVFYRKCGKPTCRCNHRGHPGHGPQTTLTAKKEGKTQAVNLATAAAVETARHQVANHDRFREWLRKWQDFNEEIADLELAEALVPSVVEESSPQKKLRRRSRKSSGRKSTG